MVTNHEAMCHMIDKSFAGAISVEEELRLSEHLLTCPSCAEYLSATQQAIASLNGFSFDVDPGLEARVLESLFVSQKHSAPLWWSRLLALLFTIVGSLAAMRLANGAGEVFHLQASQIHFGLFAFWIGPSACFCLLFLVLSVSPSGWANKKGLSL